MEVLYVAEHADIDISLDRLLSGGELALDQRIASRGYLEISISKGRLRLRATKFVGRIPLNDNVILHVKPKANIANLSHMIVRAGHVPTIIQDFARGYKPLFEQSEKAIELYYPSYLKAVARVVERGVLKRYVRVENPPKWRGRLMLASTVNRYLARGIHYNPVFEFTTLSKDVLENRLIKTALINVIQWLSARPENAHKRRVPEALSLLRALDGISELKSPLWNAVAETPRAARSLSSHMNYYREALWAAYAILQRAIPDLVGSGYVSLESMIVDVSSVFEAYARTVIADKARDMGLVVRDGNIHPRPFFAGGDGPPTKPDIIIEKGAVAQAVLDVKYKAIVHEQDRYELLAFMEATGAKHGAFICPKMEDRDQSRFLGTTPGGRSMGVIRFDLGAANMQAEEDKMFGAVMKVVEGSYDF